MVTQNRGLCDNRLLGVILISSTCQSLWVISDTFIQTLGLICSAYVVKRPEIKAQTPKTTAGSFDIGPMLRPGVVPRHIFTT